MSKVKKRILITGSNGFLGRSFIDDMDKNSYDIFALSSKDEFNEKISKIEEYFSVDISKPFDLQKDFDVVIHLAALNQTNINSDFAYEKFKYINVNGTKNVINCCTFKKFIFFSTANIYDKKTNKVDESSALDPISFYEQSKYEAELVCEKYISKEKLVIVRPVNITGIKQENKAIVPFFFSRAVKDESINIFVPKNKRIQLMSVSDLLKAMESIICNDNISGIFNLSNKESIEVRELAKKIVELCNSNSDVICTNDNVEKYVEINSDKAKKILKWQAENSIDKIINDYGNFLLK